MRKKYSDEKLLENYLSDLEGYLLHLPIMKRYEILNEAREHALNLQDQKAGSLQDVFCSLSDRTALINHFLIKHNLPTVTKKKQPFWRYVLLTMISLIVLGTLAIIILIKSMMPLFDFNDEDGTLTLFGGKFVFEKDDNTYFNSRQNKTNKWKTGYSVDLKGSVPSYGVSKIFINSQNVDFAIRSKKDVFEYNCRTDNSKMDALKRDADQLTLDLPPNAQCMIYVPEEVPFIATFKNGLVNIKDLKQSFKLELNNGTISWKQEDADKFNLNTEFQRAVIQGDKSLFQNKGALYKVDFVMDNGLLRLRR